MADNPDITAGTASVTLGTKAVTGVGTFWSTDEIRSGDLFASDGYPGARIDTVNSDTSITLRDNWRGSSLPTGSSYYIRYQPDGSRYAALLAGVRKILSLPNLTALSGLVGAAGRIPIFTGFGTMSTVDKLDLVTGVNADKKVATLAGRAAYDGENTGFSVLVANVGDGRSAIYFKNSATVGDWSPPAYLTGPNGSFQSKGAYSNATAYVAGDVVLQNGSSWIARVSTTGNPPPALPATSNTQWFLLSAAGNGFVFKGDYAGATAYLKDDVVLYNNSSWIALQPTTGNTPPALPATSNAYWSLIAAKGAGDVSGPVSSTDGNIALFNGTTGKVIADAGFSVDRKSILATKGANFTAILSDNNGFIRFSASATLSLTAAATLGANWHMYVSAVGGDVIIDPNGSEQINGTLTIVIPRGESTLIVCDGSAFYSLSRPGAKGTVSTGRWAVSSNGMLVQSGTIVAPTGASGNITITFATAFASTDYDVVGYLGDNLAPVLITERRADHVAASTTFISYNPGTGAPLPSGTTLRLTYVAFGVAP